MTIALHTPTTSRLWQDAPILTGLAIIITLASLPILECLCGVSRDGREGGEGMRHPGFGNTFTKR